ncbi:MAG: hypothetical protein CM1200mP38_2470 [Dehalococcoidia bacterium]|nr:MAG: hypothetical protein CM1200mP38_2470 [Dehalococcoidia bacterium]
MISPTIKFAMRFQYIGIDKPWNVFVVLHTISVTL